MGRRSGYSNEGVRLRLRIPGIENQVPPGLLPQGFGYATELGTVDFDLDDEFSLSTNVGVPWEITEWIALRVTYRSKSSAHMKGQQQ